MTLDDTNIISDDDFLNEILNNVQKEVAEKKDTQDELDRLLGITPDDQQQDAPVENENKPEEQPDGDQPENQDATSEEQIEEEEKTTLKRFGVKDTVTTLIENDTWRDMPIKYGDKEYESITDLLDKEKPSKELFEMLSVAQRNLREEEINQAYIKIEDRDSPKAKLAQAILEGVPYQDLVQNYDDVIEPLQRIDFTTLEDGERIAEEFVKQCLIEIDGYHPASVDAAVQTLKANFQLIDAAEKYQQTTIDNFNSEVEARRAEQVENARKQAEQVKEDMKKLRQELKSQNLPDSFASKILKLRYNIDPNSGKYHYQELLENKLQDKAFEARLLHFLLDDQDFINKEKSKVKTETQTKYLELMKITPGSKGSSQTSKPKSGNLEMGDEDFLRDLGLLKE